jgi:hypothetical protein
MKKIEACISTGECGRDALHYRGDIDDPTPVRDEA